VFNHILVPLDGSKLSEASLGPAAYLAQKLKSHVTLLHVIEQDAPAEVHRDSHLTKPDEAEAYLKETARRAFPPDVGVETHVHTAPVSDVVRSIVEHAASEIQPDLIVICTHGRGGIRDVLFGSIAQQVVARGKIPLLLIKPGGPPFKLDQLLVPLDPDWIHEESLPMSESFARIFGAEVHLLCVTPTFSTLAGEDAATGNLMPATVQAVLDMEEENARRDLAAQLERLQGAGLKASAEMTRGDPATTIAKIAEESGADLILLSTHRKAGMDAFWARSVAPKVVQRTRIPSLLIPLFEPKRREA
jgi:nucleotide-binding universal stress UspA family protein